MTPQRTLPVIFNQNDNFIYKSTNREINNVELLHHIHNDKTNEKEKKKMQKQIEINIRKHFKIRNGNLSGNSLKTIENIRKHLETI